MLGFDSSAIIVFFIVLALLIGIGRLVFPWMLRIDEVIRELREIKELLKKGN